MIMFDDFTASEIDTGATTIRVQYGGRGPAILFLHGFAQTHLMWHGVAPRLAQHFSVVCADLRGYGHSGCPPSRPAHTPYSKRTTAGEMVIVMERRGFPRFSVAGHDRGGRVAYRLALDHADRIERLAALDIVPTESAWARADSRFALAFWPWSLVAQSRPLPERVLAAAADAVVDQALSEWGSPPAAFLPETRAAYMQDSGPVSSWQEWSENVQGQAIEAGHFFPEEVPEQTAEALGPFFWVLSSQYILDLDEDLDL